MHYLTVAQSDSFKQAAKDATKTARITYAYNLTATYLNQKMSPVLDFTKASYTSIDWPFTVDCHGGKDTCVHDLSLHVNHS